jgi:hypothetical protein
MSVTVTGLPPKDKALRLFTICSCFMVIIRFASHAIGAVQFRPVFSAAPATGAAFDGTRPAVCPDSSIS